MFEQYLTGPAVIGSTCIPASDGADLLMYSTFAGKRFLKSRDHFRTVEDSWLTTIGTMTANANLLRLADGRLMMAVKLASPNRRISELGGADFAVMFSEDDGRSFGRSVRVNQTPGCYYVMNQRLLRLSSGRILLPAARVPEDKLEEKLETVDQSACFYSDDEGASWQESEWIPGETVDQLAEPMAAEGPDGRLHLFMRTGMGHIYRSESTDGGRTWSQEAPTGLRSPCAPFCVVRDPFAARLLAVWDNSFPGPVHQYPRCPICLAESTDGVNWRMIRELDADPAHGYGYPMICPCEEEILITYYESPTRKFDSRSNRLKMKLLTREEAR